MVEHKLNAKPRIKALIFDLDGTLYLQGPLRRAMAARLVSAHLTTPLLGLRTARVLSAYRRAQEWLRDADSSTCADLAAAQLRMTCEWTRARPDFVSACVARWIEQEPVRQLPSLLRPGLVKFLHTARASGLKLAVLSDYPAEAKLHALGLDAMFDVVLSAQSPGVGVFKPNPRGLYAVMDLLAVESGDCMYVGDRADVDATAAAAAGVRCFIVGATHGLEELQQRLFDRAEVAQLHLDLA